MHFVYPNFLWALFFIAVPIIIHLFHFRRYKKVYFSNTKLLTEIKDERSSKNRLKHLLILLSRILAVIFLVLAFAQPFFTKNKKIKPGNNQVSIYIDNSFSMKAEGTGYLLFDRAKEIGEDIVNSYSENDKFQVLTNDFEGKHQRFVTSHEALSFIENIKVSSAQKSLKSILNKQKSLIKDKEKQQVIYLVSDFQKNNFLFKNDTNLGINLIKLQNIENKNIYVDSVWFSQSFQLKNATNTMIVKLSNESNELQNGNYQLILNEKVKNIGEYSIASNSSILDTVRFKLSKSGWNTGKIEISDYPIEFDDQYYFSFFVDEKVKMLNISESKDRIFKAVFEEIESVDYESLNYKKIDYNKLNNYHFIILDRIETLPSGLNMALKSYVENGGSVFLVPNKNISSNSYNAFLSSMQIGKFLSLEKTSREIKSLNLKHEILNDLFEEKPKEIQLPKIKSYYKFHSKSISENPILAFQNGDTYLSSFSYESGSVYVLTAPLESTFSDFSSNAIFAPIVYKMAVLSVLNGKLSNEINTNTLVKIKNRFLKQNKIGNDNILRLKSGGLEFFPHRSSFNGFTNLSIQEIDLNDGIYDVVGSSAETVSKVALNFNRKESLMKFYSEKELKDRYPEENIQILTTETNNVLEEIRNNKYGNVLWKWFILICLLFLAFEILLLRFFKV